MILLAFQALPHTYALLTVVGIPESSIILVVIGLDNLATLKLTSRIFQLQEHGRHLSDALKEQGESVAEAQTDLGQLQDFTRAEFGKLQRHMAESQKEPILAKDLTEQMVEKVLIVYSDLRKLHYFTEDQFDKATDQ
jgi:hypothetical protein